MGDLIPQHFVSLNPSGVLGLQHFASPNLLFPFILVVLNLKAKTNKYH
jgi:hypothetical protein